jgi:hypothetical protein
MSVQQLELALKKQRLQFKSDLLREQWQGHARALAPVLGIADQARAGVAWLRLHPEVLAGVGVAVVVAKPRACWRWLKRAFAAWQLLRKGQRLLGQPGR